MAKKSVSFTLSTTAFAISYFTLPFLPLTGRRRSPQPPTHLTAIDVACAMTPHPTSSSSAMILPTMTFGCLGACVIQTSQSKSCRALWHAFSWVTQHTGVLILKLTVLLCLAMFTSRRECSPFVPGLPMHTHTFVPTVRQHSAPIIGSPCRTTSCSPTTASKRYYSNGGCQFLIVRHCLTTARDVVIPRCPITIDVGSHRARHRSLATCVRHRGHT
jgi:hypothetical protein